MLSSSTMMEEHIKVFHHPDCTKISLYTAFSFALMITNLLNLCEYKKIYLQITSQEDEEI